MSLVVVSLFLVICLICFFQVVTSAMKEQCDKILLAVSAQKKAF